MNASKRIVSPLARKIPGQLDEIDTELKGGTDRIVELIGELSQ